MPGRVEIDMLSWLFLAVFYLAPWWVGFEVDHVGLYQISNRTPDGISLVGLIRHPLEVLAMAVAIGLGSWNLKQEGKLS